MNYWIFKANPDIYDLDTHLRNGEYPTWWRVSRFRKEIKAGDICFVWRTGSPRGIVAIADITSDAWFREYDSEDPHWSGEYKVSIAIRAHFPIMESDFLKSIYGLGNLSTFHGYQAATNFRVTPEEGVILISLIKQWSNMKLL